MTQSNKDFCPEQAQEHLCQHPEGHYIQTFGIHGLSHKLYTRDIYQGASSATSQAGHKEAKSTKVTQKAVSPISQPLTHVAPHYKSPFDQMCCDRSQGKTPQQTTASSHINFTESRYQL